MNQRNLEDVYNTMGLEGLQRIIASNPVDFANEKASGAVRISPNQTVDLRSGNITQQGDPVPRPRTLTELINVAKRVTDPVHGVPREVGQPLLRSMVETFQREAGLTPQQASLKRLVELPQREQEFKAQQRGGREPSLPPDLIGAIGTPGFTQRLQQSAGDLDRSSVNMLMNLDRAERQFQAKGVAKPGKLSPYAQKLHEMDALGIPITEATVRGVYGNKEDVKVPLRPISLSRLAGLKGRAADEQTQPIEEEDVEPSSDLRRLLFGEK